ncbi:hypothetical protein [Comamonas brasiliensis]|nr:hypothetical protein [Comamonas sp. PE63]
MSASAAWSYTAKATHWALLGRDDWSGQLAFAPPVTFDCDYKSEAVRSSVAGGTSPATGVELALRHVIYTEYSAVKQGDYVLIGESPLPDPLAAGAVEVRTVVRDADTFERMADDFRILT